MPSSPLSFFTAKYEGEPLQVRKKSRILAGIASSFVGISLVLGVLMAVTKAMVVAGVFVGLALFCAAVLALLRTGKYHVASSAFLYVVFAAMFIAIKFDQYQNIYETYVIGTLGCFLLVVTTLIADKPRQAIIIGLLVLAAIEAIYWLDSFPKDGYTVSVLAIQNLATSSVLTAIGAGVAAYLVRMTSSLLGQVEREAKAAERSYDELNSAMGRAQSASLRIGESLSASVERTSGSIESLRSRVLDIACGMDELDGALSLSGEASKKAEDSQLQVRGALDSYSQQISMASAAIEEMAAAAAMLETQAISKRAAVVDLVEAARQGESILSSMGQSMGEIEASAKRVAELGAIIGDIADRTNLLGMNASIEAAHAGAAGRGFAVVAGEIRSLSIEAGKSAHVIADTLKQVMAAISTTAVKSGRALDSFRKISEDIRGVSEMIEELLGSIHEVSAGSAEVVSVVETIADLTTSTEAAVASSRQGLDESLRGMDSVAEIASRVRVETAEMSRGFDEMRQDSEAVRRLGGENLGTIQALKAGLDGFALKSEGSPARRAQPSRGISVKRAPG